MGNVYVYEADATGLPTIGLVGALSPSECLHEKIGNGASELTLVHPVDRWGRYGALVPDRILRAPVPVRTCPEITSGSIVTSFEVWTVKSTASKSQRHVYSAKSGGKKKKLLKTTGRRKSTLAEGQMESLPVGAGRLSQFSLGALKCFFKGFPDQ